MAEENVVRVRYIEPNDVFQEENMSFGSNVSRDNIVFNPENMIMALDLQVISPDRMNIGQRDIVDEIKEVNEGVIPTRSIFGGSYIESDSEEKRHLTTDYISMSFSELNEKGYMGQEMLMISSINIKYNARMMPVINIKFIDIKGYALMMPSEHERYLNLKKDDTSVKYSSVFKAFFRFPYPRFLLTVKGFFGGSVTFSLSVTSFKTSFDSKTGNFIIDVTFSGYETAFISDLPFNFVLMAPYIGGSEGNVNSFWRKEDFISTDKTTILPTFIEFINAMANLLSFSKKAEDGTTGNKRLDDTVKGRNELSEIDLFDKSFRNMLNNGIEFKKVIEGNRYIGFFKKNGNIGFNVNIVNEYLMRYKDFVKKYRNNVGFDKHIDSNGNFKSLTTVNYRGDRTKYTFRVESDVIAVDANTGERIIDAKLAKEMFDADVFGWSAFFYDKYSVRRVIEEERKKTQGKIATKEEINNIYAKMNGTIEENLGIKLTIRNMMRIIFAHVDCFLSCMYDMLDKIHQNQNRRLRDFGIMGTNGNNTMGISTDLSNNGMFDENDKLPPFTTFYRKNEEGMNEEVFPGDIPGLEKLEEINFIDNFINTLFVAKKRLTDAEFSTLNAMIGIFVEKGEETKPLNVNNETIRKFRLSLYRSLKTLYDRWLAGMSCKNFKLRKPETEMEEMRQKLNYGSASNDKGSQNISYFSNFLYVDSFFNDIGDILITDPKYLYDTILDHNNGKNNFSVYNVISNFLQKNHMSLISLPVFNNFYSAHNMNNVFRIDPLLRRMNNEGTTYICLYTYEVSKISNQRGEYEQDYVDLSDTVGEVGQVERDKLFGKYIKSGEGNQERLEINIPAFGVTFARQNQTYFKSIKVTMDNGKVGNNAIQKMMAMSSIDTNGIVQRPVTASQDSYSIFSNYQYQCTVEMYGCMEIMPGMYFQLNNIPLFKGAYMITSVEHSIKPGDMTTKFTGLRISKISVPYIEHVGAMNSYMNKLNEAYRPDMKIKEKKHIIKKYVK